MNCGNKKIPQYCKCSIGNGFAEIGKVLINSMFDTPTHMSAGQAVSSLLSALTVHSRQIFQRVTVCLAREDSTSQNCESCFPLGSGDLEVNVCNGSLAGKYRNNSACIFCQGQGNKIWECRLSYKRQRGLSFLPEKQVLLSPKCSDVFKIELPRERTAFCLNQLRPQQLVFASI